jgi:hypothetical protein
MNLNNGKALTPLAHGNILIVGVKSSNLSDEIKTHPRVTLWESQQQHWTNKELPENTRAVFVTRFIGHVAFDKILTEARKKQITIFNPTGTGIVSKQVRELLGLDKRAEEEPKMKTRGKLIALHAFIDFTKTDTENAKLLAAKAVEMGIVTTERSLANSVGTLRRKQSGTGKLKSLQPKLDVTVEILDGMIRELQDMRAFLIATVDENKMLRTKLSKFKQVLEGDLS